MATSVRFELKRNGNSVEKLISLRFSFGYYKINNVGKKIYLPFYYSTGKKIEPQFWDSSRQRANVTYVRKFGKQLNAKLNKYEVIIDKIYQQYEFDQRLDELNHDVLHAEMDKELNKVNYNDDSNIIKFIENYILANSQKSINKKAKETIQKYDQLISKLTNYQAETNVQLTFSNLTKDHYLNFFEFCNIKYSKKDDNGNSIGLAINTLHGLQKTFKKFLNEATKEGYTIQFNYKDSDLTIPEQSVKHIFLTLDELERLSNANLKGLSSSYELALDLFMVMAFTGIRYEDLNIISDINVQVDTDIDGKEYCYLSLVNDKTSVTTVVPILPIIRRIYIKYGNQFPKPPASQTINNKIKELGVIAEINEPTKVERIRNSKRVGEILPKHTFITNHTAKRSFVSNSTLLDVPQFIISKISHPDDKKGMFELYNKVDLIQNTELYFRYIRRSKKAEWLL